MDISARAPIFYDISQCIHVTGTNAMSESLKLFEFLTQF